MRATSVRRERSESATSGEAFGYGDAPASPRRTMGKRRPSLNLFSRQGSGRNLGDKQGSAKNLNAESSPPDSTPGGPRRRPSLNLFSRQGSGRNLGDSGEGDSIAASLTKATKGALKSTAKQIRKGVGISRGDDDKQLLGSDSEGSYGDDNDVSPRKSRKSAKKERSMSMDQFGLDSAPASPKKQQSKRSVSALRQATIEVDERFGGKGRSGPVKSSKRGVQEEEDCYKPVERMDWKFNAYYHGDSESWRVGGAKKKSTSKSNFNSKPAYSTEEMKPDSSDESTPSSDDSDSSTSSNSDTETTTKKKSPKEASKATTPEQSADDKLDRKYAAASASAVSVGQSAPSNYGRLSRIRKRTSLNNAATTTQEDENKKAVEKTNSADSSSTKLPPLTRRGRTAGQLDGSSGHNRRALSAQRNSSKNGMDTSGHSMRSHSTTRSTRSNSSGINSNSLSPVKSSSRSPIKRLVDRIDLSKTDANTVASGLSYDNEEDDKKRRGRRNRDDQEVKENNLQSPGTENDDKGRRRSRKKESSSDILSPSKSGGEDDIHKRKNGSSFQSPGSEDDAKERPKSRHSSAKGDSEDKHVRAPPRTRDNKVGKLIRTNSENSVADVRNKFEKSSNPDVVRIAQSPTKQRNEKSTQSVKKHRSAPPMTRETRSRKPTRTFSDSDAVKSKKDPSSSNPNESDRSTSRLRPRASFDFGGQKSSSDDDGRSTSRLRRRGSLDFFGKNKGEELKNDESESNDDGRSTSRLRRRGSLDFFGKNKGEELQNDESESNNDDGMLAMVNSSRHTTATSESSYDGSEIPPQNATRGRRRGSLLGAIGNVFTSTSQDEPAEEEKAFEDYDDGRIRPNFPGHELFSYFLPEDEPIVWVDMIEGGKSRKDKKKKHYQNEEEAIQYPELNVFFATRNSQKKEPYMPVGPIRESPTAISAGLRRK